jgi:hypothetical protein
MSLSPSTSNNATQKTQNTAQAQEQEQEQEQDMTAMDIARAWGDLLGVEVGVRTLRRNGGFRVEVLFSSAEAALASAAWLGKAPAGASKRG